MNTLKLKLFAASMFACSAAFAQSAGGQISGPPATRTPTSNANAFTPQAVGTRQGTYLTDSYILQNGTSQYASQTQDGYRNTADIYQNYSNAAGKVNNNATQFQSNDGRDGRGDRNTVYISQAGSSSNADQRQIGTGSVASIRQGTGTGNNATQYQNGMNNSADISQDGSSSNAIQYQVGSNDAARITQGGASGNYAEQRQMGGNGNQATTTQSAGYGTFNYTEQNGSNNRAVVNQVYDRAAQVSLIR
jgi:hypothetical protein